MPSKNLLIELLVEELPPKALERLGSAFAESIHRSLSDQHLIWQPGTINPDESEPDPPPYESFASPRRLAVLVRSVLSIAPELQMQQKLMPVSVGLDTDGQPTAALRKKLTGLGVAPGAIFETASKLRRKMDGKVEALFLDSTVPGATVAEGLQKALDEALVNLPIPKTMSYQLSDGWTGVKFVRPAHALVALHGADIIPVGALGLSAGRETHGHRFEANVEPIVLKDADSYAAQLENEGSVIASFAARRAEIEKQISAAAEKAGKAAGVSLKPVSDEALLDEVTALVERPNVLTCQFEKEYLDVPQECLILTMKANQKYFPLLDGPGKLTNQFLIVSNISPADTSAVIQGNERVVRPRLADAKFFFDQDRKKTLASRVAGLAKVVYHNKLGTQGERSERVRAIGHAIVNQLRMATHPYTALAKDELDVLDSKVQEAARLAKCDLLTDMVGEFPELQGIMGGYYARHEGLRDGVAIAIEDHYKPRFAGDALPRNHTGAVVALADKLETLAGLFGIGQAPTGDKDPFALRRHALGVIRILIEHDISTGLKALVDAAFAAFPPETLDPSASSKIIEFIFDRLANQLREQGYTAQEVDAVLALQPDHLKEIPKRLAAVRAFAALPEAAALAAANKRVGNILKKVDGTVEAKVNVTLLNESAEVALNATLVKVVPAADAAFQRGDYTASLKALSALREPVDAFFEKVMVNAEDAKLRANRLGLLATLHAAMNRVADLSKLAA